MGSTKPFGDAIGIVFGETGSRVPLSLLPARSQSA